MANESALSSHLSRAEAVDRAWANLITSGPTLNSAERLSVLAVARSAWVGEGDSNRGGLLEEAAYWLAKDAGGLTGEVVADFEARGLDRFRYLEVVGLVARLSNVDFYRRGLGLEAIAFPEADGTSPTGEIEPSAAITDGFVPATGPLFAPGSLDAFPAEGAALRDLHEPMYMPMKQMGDPGFVDVLTRAQIEFIAGRTSFLNECFY